ncbi:MAG: EAL domain-containing protein [Candidatus Competibacteraceae bacterium]|uniref:Response regulator receiver modulated diguanylate cyclase/phosphodiesterase with PAS/PAC sensor(S) n=1 Tax=Candidatus Contendobacter odensis Run_B_J11 TaxID=1400861 RepID=A0A7U7GFG9_9GAMM|nr:EAL domain-containing protein [Candidatus Contendobacter odensis]MBK8537408.1 EAL domain-containing protein [Candidatus Competibacteraceae bacterium]MBK8753779.1 EAL domain-containing protein [Candidatus Competibacteraceae bacterium]CDH47413.1 Response regulator receiver modulated diguanylate cyclase/phosphodiesterase with PAS/PAC sensor(S) [Candidatus Contendobacter odensis Run_B_J11]
MKDQINECSGEVEEPAPPFSVLVVDDEPYIRAGLEQLLTAQGYLVAIAGGGSEAIKQLTEHRYDLLVLDLGMPGVGGAAVLDFVAERCLDLAAIIISGTTSVTEATTALGKGAVDYLRKPFGPEELLDCVTKARRSLQQKRSRRLMCNHLEASERLHRFIVNYSPDLIFVLDAAGHFTYLNQRVPGLLGFEIDALTGQPLTALVDAVDQEKATHLLRHLAETGSEKPQFVELRLLRNAASPYREPDSPLIVEVTALAIRDEGDPSRFIGSYIAARDVSARWQAEEALRRASMRLEHVVSASPAVIYSCDPGPGMPVTFISSNVYELLGYRADELLADEYLLDRLIHPEDRSHREHDLDCMAASHQMNRAYRLRHRYGGWRWIRDTVRLVCDAGGQPVELVGSWLDNTEAQLLAEQLTHQASHDALTGLANRRAFEQRLQRALESVRDQSAEHALFYLDLDQFKVINDTCGHLAGDDLLRQLARVLQIRVRKQDILARLGGDEFGVLMEYCPLHDALRVANTLCQAVNDFRFAWDGKTFRLGVSIGVVAISAASDNFFSGVLSAADSACYAAKDAGRNRVHLYTEDDAELARRQGEMQWVARINQALEENRFQLAFQPIVPILGASKGHHYELLLRMEGESGQILMPSAFLPAAERYHLAAKLDQWVVSTALDWLSSNPHHLDHLALCAINLSGHSLGDEYLLDYLVDRLARPPLLAEKLCFEVTETAAIANLGSALHFIQTLKNIGCRFALDDFGSGLSSFAYLKKLPVDFLKIDGMFVEDIVNDPVSLAMVNSINEIGHVMGMETIAEFVKDDQILTKLRTIGVNYAQGYGIGKPRPLTDLALH